MSHGRIFILEVSMGWTGHGGLAGEKISLDPFANRKFSQTIVLKSNLDIKTGNRQL